MGAIQKGKGVYNKYMKLCEEFQTKRKSTPKQKTPSPQLGKLQKFVSNCYNDVDPITQEEFTEEQIPNIVKIGNGSKKYCFELFPLYRYLVSERLKLSEPIINPSTREILSREDVQKITAEMKAYLKKCKFPEVSLSKKMSDNIIQKVKTLLLDHYNDIQVLSIRDSTFADVLFKYNELLKKGHKTEAYILRVVWEFFYIDPVNQLIKFNDKAFYNSLTINLKNKFIAKTNHITGFEEMLHYIKIKSFTPQHIKAYIQEIKKIDIVGAQFILSVYNS